MTSEQIYFLIWYLQQLFVQEVSGGQFIRDNGGGWQKPSGSEVGGLEDPKEEKCLKEQHRNSLWSTNLHYAYTSFTIPTLTQEIFFALNSNQNFTSRQKKFITAKINKIRVGFNCLANRLYTIKGTVPLDFLNLAMGYFKVHCKTILLTWCVHVKRLWAVFESKITILLSISNCLNINFMLQTLCVQNIYWNLSWFNWTVFFCCRLLSFLGHHTNELMFCPE